MRNVVIASPIETQSGYGQHAREFVEQMLDKKANEWDIKLISLPWGNTPRTVELPDAWKSRIVTQQLPQQPDVWVQCTVPNEFAPIGKYNIGITAGSEGNVCSPKWIDNLNSFQLIIVPSVFTKTVFEQTAIRAKKKIKPMIKIIPEYFAKEYDNTAKMVPIDGLADIKENFNYLFVGHWLPGMMGQDRKDVSGLIHTFYKTYKGVKDAPGLVLKVSNGTYAVMDYHMLQQKCQQIGELHGGKDLPNIYIIHGDLTEVEMNSLYNHKKIKAMVSFTKGEGFGRPLLEFATTGKPILAPYYSGQVDFLKKDFICALPGGQTPIHPSAQNKFLIKGSTWHTVDYPFAGKMFKDVRKNYKKWVELSKRQRYFAITNFSNDAESKIYKDIFGFISEQIKSIPIEQKLNMPVDIPKLKPLISDGKPAAMPMPDLKGSAGAPAEDPNMPIIPKLKIT